MPDKLRCLKSAFARNNAEQPEFNFSITERLALIIIKQILSGLNIMHKNMYIHSELTLDNIYISDNSEVKILVNSPVKMQLGFANYNPTTYSHLPPEVLL